jgi:hypothetical protein
MSASPRLVRNSSAIAAWQRRTQLLHKPLSFAKARVCRLAIPCLARLATFADLAARSWAKLSIASSYSRWSNLFNNILVEASTSSGAASSNSGDMLDPVRIVASFVKKNGARSNRRRTSAHLTLADTKCSSAANRLTEVRLTRRRASSGGWHAGSQLFAEVLVPSSGITFGPKSQASVCRSPHSFWSVREGLTQVRRAAQANSEQLRSK